VASAPYPCEQVVPIEQEPHHRLVIASKFVRAFAVEIPPHTKTLCHRHAHEYLMYVVGDTEIVSAPRDGEPQMHSYRDGGCEHSQAGVVHVVENMRNTKFRNLLVELRPALGGLRRGSGPVNASGPAGIGLCFEMEQAAIWVLQLHGGSQVEVCGPAVVASPYGSKVELVGPATKRALEEFTDLAWIAPSTRAMLRSHAEHPAKVVFIGLGRR
jgi:hypothetical protein